jgi:hypothetical protein
MEEVRNDRDREQPKKMKALLLRCSKDYFPYAFSYVRPAGSQYQPRKKVGIANFSRPNCDTRHLCSDLLRPFAESDLSYMLDLAMRGENELSPAP